MGTKIELQYPYCKDWKFGYLVTNNENRKTVILYNSPKHRSSTQYARYLLAVENGRYLSIGESADHIDGDKTNDDILNLQILSPIENIRKSCKLPNVEMLCPVCGMCFSKTRSELRGKLEKAFQNKVCCSRSCGRKMNNINIRG